MKFTKMHGIGNDYIYIFGETTLDFPSFAREYSPRHTGIGSDGVIHILLGQHSDFIMHMYNADGSRGTMCGNGIRCVGKYLYDQGLTKKTQLTIETDSGIRTLFLKIGENQLVQRVSVNMGQGTLGKTLCLHALNKDFHGTFVDVGNPHFVVPCEDPMNIPVEEWGRALETHPEFSPHGVNVEFVTPTCDGFTFRVWERGSGETYACGTGACACFASLLEKKLISSPCTAQLLGGTLDLWMDQGDIFMEGEATTVYHGSIPSINEP